MGKKVSDIEREFRAALALVTLVEPGLDEAVALSRARQMLLERTGVDVFALVRGDGAAGGTKAEEETGSAERFVADWLASELPVPVAVAPTREFYAAYSLWAEETGVRHPESKRQVIRVARRLTDRKRDKARFVRGSKRVFERVVWPLGLTPPVTYGAVVPWVTWQTEEFTGALRDWQAGRA